MRVFVVAYDDATIGEGAARNRRAGKAALGQLGNLLATCCRRMGAGAFASRNIVMRVEIDQCLDRTFEVGEHIINLISSLTALAVHKLDLI